MCNSNNQMSGSSSLFSKRNKSKRKDGGLLLELDLAKKKSLVQEGQWVVKHTKIKDLSGSTRRRRLPLRLNIELNSQICANNNQCMIRAATLRQQQLRKRAGDHSQARNRPLLSHGSKISRHLREDLRVNSKNRSLGGTRKMSRSSTSQSNSNQ